MKKLLAFLSSKKGSVTCLAVAIISRIINICFVSYTGRDKMFLVLQSKNLLQGKGFGVPGYFTSHPDVVVIDHTPMWPPGYSVVLAPFLKIFNYSIYWSTTTLDVVTCIALIFIIRKICNQIGFPVAATNIMTLIAGCFEYSFINDSKPTDNVSIFIFLLAISLVIKLLSSDRFSIAAIAVAAFILFLPTFFRYSYPPLSIAVSSAILFAGILKHDPMIKKKGLGLFVITISLTAVFFIIMKLTTGYAGYALPTARGYFPENLLHWFPVVPTSFINIIFLTSQTNLLLDFSVDTTLRVLEVINVIVILALIAVFLFLFFNKRFLASSTSFNWFFIIGFFVNAATFVSLGYLSFTYAPQDWGKTLWTYVFDHRYYAFTFIYLQIIFLGWVFLNKKSLKNIFFRIVAILCSLFLFIEITHNIYFHTKVAFNFKEYKSNVYREQDYNYFFKLITELENKYPGYEIWSGAPGDDFYAYAATYFGHTGIMDSFSFKNNSVHVKKKTILAFVLYDHEITLYDDFLRQSKIIFTNHVAESNYYVIELLP